MVLAVLAVLAVVADVGARRVAEGKIEDRVRSETRGVASADARIRSFPFLGRLLVAGSVPRVQVHLTKVLSGPLELATVDIDLRGVRLDRDKVLTGEAQLEDIDHGTITVELDADVIGEALNLPVSIEGDTVSVQVRGVSVPARIEVGRNGSLMVGIRGLRTFTVPVVRTPRLMPCEASSAAVAGGRVRLSCEITDVPPGLRG